MEDKLTKTLHKNLGERLVQELNSIKEPRNLVITSHLFIELLVGTFLEAYFANPKDNLPRFFGSKFSLIKAIGFLSNKVCTNIKVTNKIRNKFAHDLNAQLELSDFNDIDLSKFNKQDFDSLNLINKFNLLSADTILSLNNECGSFLSKRARIIKKGGG